MPCTHVLRVYHTRSHHVRMEVVYRSHPLDHQREEIRLLSFTPCAPSDPVVGTTLSTVSLSAKPRYHALSYVWGGASRSHKIRTEGCDLRTTKNLQVALRYLQSHMGTSVEALPLWVDAICINQSNLTERNEQVALMHKIYSQACNVLIWLGEGDEYSDELFDYLEDASFLESLEEARRTKARGPTQNEIRASAIFDNNIDERPWWGRIWVLQELLLAHQDPVVLCGTRCSTWDTMFRCRKLLSSPFGQLNSQSWIPYQEKPAIPCLSFNSVMSHHWHWAGLRDDFRRDGPLPLHDALIALRDTEATDKRDYVYGLLGLLKPEDAVKVIVDYTKSPMCIYKSVMEHVWTCGDVDLLSEVIPRLKFARCPETDGWPSWIPNLSEQNLDNSTAFLLGNSSPLSVPVCFPTTPQVSLSADKTTLLVAGMALDAIRNVLDLTDLDEIDVKTLADIDNILAHGQERLKLTDSRSENLHVPGTKDSLACFISGWNIEEIRSVMKFDEDEDEADRPSDACSRSQSQDAEIDAHAIYQCWSSMPATHPFKADVEGRLCGRRVFLTSHGFPGIGTPDVKAGDLVVRPFGANCQYVLRHRRSTASDYSLTGFAYLSGFMDLEELDRCYRIGALEANSFAIS